MKWVGVALACLSTLFTLTIVGSHLSGRLYGLGKIGILGTVGAELTAITCAWLVASEEKRMALVAMICQVILTGVLLINASVALDLDWQESMADRTAERQISGVSKIAEERRKTLEKQAELAWRLAEKDKLLARAFVAGESSAGKERARFASSPASDEGEEPIVSLPHAPVSVYERYGLTIAPLFLALLTLVALGTAAKREKSLPKS